MYLQCHPVRDPARRRITQGFGEHPEWYSKFSYQGVPLRGHNAIDFGIPIGTEIQAVDDGKVVEASYDADGFGHYLKINHSWGESLYAHLSVPAPEATTGRSVDAGQIIGRSGNTGNSTGPHLHFAIRVNPYRRDDGWGGYCDPAPYLRALEEPTEQLLCQIREGAWKERGISYNSEATLAKYARDHDLGAPITEEFDIGKCRVQGFVGGIVFAPVGQWTNVRHTGW